MTPSSASFDDTLVEGMSAPQRFTVRNDGSATAVLAGVEGTSAAEFVIQANGCGSTLQPGASCEIRMVFAPRTRSGARTASLALSGPSGVVARAGLTATAIPSLTLLAGAVGGAGYADGKGTNARFYNPVGVASDGAGNLYVADSYTYTVRKIDAAGVVTTLAGTPRQSGSADGTGATASFDILTGITSDGAGNLFVTETHTVRKIAIATGAVTTVKDDTGVPLNIGGPSGITTDRAGNLYVADTDTSKGFYESSIRRIEIATGTVTSVADRTGVIRHFDDVTDIAGDGAGNLFVADSSVLEKVVLATGDLTIVAGTPGVSGHMDGAGAAASFSSLAGIALDGAGNLFVAEDVSNTVRKVVIATGVVTSLAGDPFQYGSADGTGSDARFSNPKGLATDGVGNLFVADVYNYTIRKVVTATGDVTTLAGMASQAAGVDGTGAAARFGTPGGVATDGAGNLFVTDRDSDTIRKIVMATGVVTTFAGDGSQGLGWADGTGTAARFSVPSDIVADGAGNLFVADTENSMIRKIAIATRAVTTIAGGATQPMGADGVGMAASFDFPYGLAGDGAGNLYVADSDNGTVRKLAIATQAVTTIAGKAGQSGTADGTGAAARFYFPCGVVSDGAGNLFVADSGNGTIRKIVLATGAVTTFAGKAGETVTVDGIGTAARFTSPGGMASDGAGNLYVADGSTIRKIVLASASVSTVIGMPDRSGILLGALPASLNVPYDVTVLPTGELVVDDALENAILIAHL